MRAVLSLARRLLEDAAFKIVVGILMAMPATLLCVDATLRVDSIVHMPIDGVFFGLLLGWSGIIGLWAQILVVDSKSPRSRRLLVNGLLIVGAVTSLAVAHHFWASSFGLIALRFAWAIAACALAYVLLNLYGYTALAPTCSPLFEMIASLICASLALGGAFLLFILGRQLTLWPNSGGLLGGYILVGPYVAPLLLFVAAGSLFDLISAVVTVVRSRHETSA